MKKLRPETLNLMAIYEVEPPLEMIVQLSRRIAASAEKNLIEALREEPDYAGSPHRPQWRRGVLLLVRRYREALRVKRVVWGDYRASLPSQEVT